MAATGADFVFGAESVEVLGGEQNILGKGAYGEVRKAVWRGCPVAAKRLHFLTSAFELDADQRDNVKRQFSSEMEMLVKLRHPNLVLYLGVSLDAMTKQPEWILTERMDCSLFDVLHTFRFGFLKLSTG